MSTIEMKTLTAHTRDAELNDFLENAVIPMHWIAANGTILWANEAELTLLGYDRQEYVGHPISEFHTDQPAIDDILQRLNRNEEVRDWEARMKCKNGLFLHLHIYSNTFRQGGKFLHTRCFAIDITDKKTAEEASLRLAAIVASSNDAIVSKDLNGIVTSWNKAAERIFDYRAEEIVGQSILKIIPPELQDEEPRILATIRVGERIEHFETIRLRKDGERINVSLTISPVKDHRGNTIGIAKIARDITQQKKLEASLHTTERLAAVGRLAATVAHEINNPLEAVMNFIYLAKQQPALPEKVRRYLHGADQELGRVAHVAQQTLGFYRDNSEPVSFVLGDAIDDVLTVYERKFKYKDLQIEKRIQPGFIVYAQLGELKQILSNLIANAIDASRDGGKILISTGTAQDRRSRHGTRITIADNGAGISREQMCKLFVPFFTTKKDVGTGLGLWITKDLLGKRGGYIRIRSRDSAPSGTVVRIFVPSQSVAGSDGPFA